ncbi:DUF6882 domain-containing protein [Nocardia inohanensis]|uniref:DUF6882 domain-containing protein n=1 Tax=Nocardia inohanensis TaxID=209246 RepID=UPI000B313CB4|nr:DUF6882 domain-containing protein [Nocardia inohanensis]
METFSDALTSLARGSLGGAIDQYYAFSQAIPAGNTAANSELSKVWIGDREFDRSGHLGSFAEDRTFMWAWANENLRGMPGVAHSVRLRELGMAHRVPELTTALVDLDRFEDPWAAADQLALIAQALLGVRGMTKFNHGGRAYTYVLIDDESVPVANPDPSRAAESRQAADEILAGSVPRVVNTGGAAPAGSAPGFIPDSLLPVLAPGAPIAMSMSGVLLEAEPELTELRQRQPVWDRAAGRFFYAERPDLTFEAAEIGHFDAQRRLWEWSEFEGASTIRAIATQHEADHLAAEQVSLDGQARPANIANLLAAAAVHRGGAIGWLHAPTASGYVNLALTDPRVRARGIDPDDACVLLENAADMVHPLTRAHNRYPTMRTMAAGFLEYYGLPMLYVGEPYFVGAMFGLYEMRAEFGSEGGLIRTHFGLTGTLG